MGNDMRQGHQITPLTLWVAAGLGGALWAVLFAQNVRSESKQDAISDSVTALVASEEFKRREMDALKGDVKSVQVEVRTLAERMGKVESRK